MIGSDTSLPQNGKASQCQPRRPTTKSDHVRFIGGKDHHVVASIKIHWLARKHVYSSFTLQCRRNIKTKQKVYKQLHANCLVQIAFSAVNPKLRTKKTIVLTNQDVDSDFSHGTSLVL